MSLVAPVGSQQLAQGDRVTGGAVHCRPHLIHTHPTTHPRLSLSLSIFSPQARGIKAEPMTGITTAGGDGGKKKKKLIKVTYLVCVCVCVCVCVRARARACEGGGRARPIVCLRPSTD